jgi:multiple antibiotic resistance protein
MNSVFSANIEHFIQATIAIVAISNPLGAAPVFLALVGDVDPVKRRYAALRVSLYIFIILFVATLAGSGLLKLFGISLSAFQAGGGLIVLLMGLEMMKGRPTHVQHESLQDDETDQLLVPLAMPLIAGPGSIATVMTLAAHNPTVMGHISVTLAVVTEAVLMFIILSASVWVEKRVSERGQRIFLKFMGFILVVMGAQMALTGIKSFLFT